MVRSIFFPAPLVLNFLYCTPLKLTFGEMNESENYHLHTLPTDFTLQLAGNGTVSVYVSFTERNPNAITADFVMEGSYPLQYYVGDNDKSDFFLTVISGSTPAPVRVEKEFYDTTIVGKTKMTFQ